jgi:hypothetical protein
MLTERRRHISTAGRESGRRVKPLNGETATLRTKPASPGGEPEAPRRASDPHIEACNLFLLPCSGTSISRTTRTTFPEKR